MTPLAYRRGVRVRRGLQAPSDLRLEPVERFDDWVEPLARQVGERYPWMVRRDAAWLNWRFFESPNARFEALGVWDARDQLAAYAVVQRPSRGSAVGYLVDLVGQDASAMGAALEGCLSALNQHGVQAVRTHAIRDSAWEGFLAQHAFQPPKPQDEKWVIAYVHQPDHPLAQAALDPTQWFFTDADRDDELVR